MLTVQSTKILFEPDNEVFCLASRASHLLPNSEISMVPGTSYLHFIYRRVPLGQNVAFTTSEANSFPDLSALI